MRNQRSWQCNMNVQMSRYNIKPAVLFQCLWFHINGYFTFKKSVCSETEQANQQWERLPPPSSCYCDCITFSLWSVCHLSTFPYAINISHITSKIPMVVMFVAASLFTQYRVRINCQRISLLLNLSRKCRKNVKFVSITNRENLDWSYSRYCHLAGKA
jgi:hypothetical protein